MLQFSVSHTEGDPVDVGEGVSTEGRRLLSGSSPSSSRGLLPCVREQQYEGVIVVITTYWKHR